MSATEFWLTTERLALRRFTADDVDWLAQLYGDPDVTRYLGGTKDRVTTEEVLNVRILQYYDEYPGLGIWMTVERSSGAPVGFHLLNHIQGESIIHVGFALVKPAWGRGIGTEMAAAVLRYGFVDLAAAHRGHGQSRQPRLAARAAENRTPSARRARVSPSGLCRPGSHGVVRARLGRLAGRARAREGFEPAGRSKSSG